jgi:hypothetical protein
MTNRLRMNINRASHKVEDRSSLREKALASHTTMHSAVSNVQKEKCEVFKAEVDSFKHQSKFLSGRYQQQRGNGMRQHACFYPANEALYGYYDPQYVFGGPTLVNYNAFPNSNYGYESPAYYRPALENYRPGYFNEELSNEEAENLLAEQYPTPVYQLFNNYLTTQTIDGLYSNVNQAHQPQVNLMPSHFTPEGYSYTYAQNYNVEEELDAYYDHFEEEQALEDWHNAFGLEYIPEHYAYGDSTDLYPDVEDWDDGMGFDGEAYGFDDGQWDEDI